MPASGINRRRHLRAAMRSWRRIHGATCVQLKNASRPAHTALFIAAAMPTGSFGFCNGGVCQKRRHSPISMAIVASEAVPTPASTKNRHAGRFSMIMRRLWGFNMPHAEPIREANGMMAAQPIFSSSRAIIGSSLV